MYAIYTCNNRVSSEQPCIHRAHVGAHEICKCTLAHACRICSIAPPPGGYTTGDITRDRCEVRLGGIEPVRAHTLKCVPGTPYPHR